MISVVTWMWQGPLRTFLPQHVNALQRMVAAHLPIPHRFVCVSDSGDGLSPAVEWVETPQAARDLALLPSPEGPRFPSCYRRLWSFSREAAVLGERLLVVDIDLVVVGDLTRVLDRPEPFVGWRPYRDWGPRDRVRFGGGIYLLTAGARAAVWDDFVGQASVHRARAAGYRGSDQAWISYKLAASGQEPYWDKSYGLYSVRDLGRPVALPADAVLVQFNGNEKPWQSRVHWARAQWAKYEDKPVAAPPRPPATLGQVLGRYRMPR